MKKRILSFVTAFIMASICFGTIMAEPAAATQYMNIEADYYGSQETGNPKEKVGNYYIWISGGQLKYTASLKKKAKVLKTVREKSKGLGSGVITNGSTVFYLVQEVKSDHRAEFTIYKATIKSGKSKKIKTITKIKGMQDLWGNLAGYHSGRIYYNVSPTQWNGEEPVEMETDLYSCTLSGKDQRLEKTSYVVNQCH